MSDSDMSGYYSGINTWHEANGEIGSLRYRIKELEAWANNKIAELESERLVKISTYRFACVVCVVGGFIIGKLL